MSKYIADHKLLEIITMQTYAFEENWNLFTSPGRYSGDVLINSANCLTALSKSFSLIIIRKIDILNSVLLLQGIKLEAI